MRLAAALGSIAVVSGCTYYNAMWSAERFAKDARRLEARGQEPEARGQWARAAVKAESVLVRHPHSRWADAALVLRAEGLARSGGCAQAAAPLAEARATVRDAALQERAALAAAQCALAAGKPVEAEQALGPALASRESAHRSRAEYLAGRAAADRRDYDGAVAHYRRSTETAARPARVRALLAAGRSGDAAAVLDTLAREQRFDETAWSALLDELAAVAGPAAATVTLDRMIAHARVPFAARARLLIADGDRLLARGEHDQAAARYRQAVAAAPAAGEAGVARVREQRAVAARAAAPADLAPVVAELMRISSGSAAGGAPEAQRLLDLVVQLSTRPRSPGAAFRVAELARDSLGAARLAGRLFLDLAAADSTSLFAPKALVAALPLLPERGDSIVRVLNAAYAASPYTRALHGEASPAYAAAEDSLAQELGVEIGRALPAIAAQVDAPLTGPRGPWLDGPPAFPGRGAATAAERARQRADERNRPATERPTRDRPPRPDRP
ncbi:MAG TPA: hypothetical protein VGQ06_14270 [Gemmatimonadales bacterium]|jgi:predicted negative regulator of RcsB-dependent stress response|nr:hypothetical protein [Gemmatimonadales bacterium]